MTDTIKNETQEQQYSRHMGIIADRDAEMQRLRELVREMGEFADDVLANWQKRARAALKGETE